MKILDDFGYDDKKQEKILNSYAVGRYSLDNLEGKIINTFDFFRKMNYSDNDIISMTVLNPTLFNYSSKTLKNRFGFLDCLGYSKEEVELLIECARKNNLYITGGSDYHGKNKDIPLAWLNSDNIPIDFKMFKFFSV